MLNPAIPVPPPPKTRRVRHIPVPTLSELNLSQQDRGKQAESIRQDAYRFAKLFGRDILQALRDKDKNGVKDRVIQWGIAADKVLGGAESSGFLLTVPQALLDKLLIAVNVKAPAPQVIDKPTDQSEKV